MAQKTKAEYQKELANFKRRYNSLSKKHEKLEKEITHMREELDIAAVYVMDKEKVIENLENEAASLKNEIGLKNTQISELMSQLNEATATPAPSPIPPPQPVRLRVTYWNESHFDGTIEEVCGDITSKNADIPYPVKALEVLP